MDPNNFNPPIQCTLTIWNPHMLAGQGTIHPIMEALRSAGVFVSSCLPVSQFFVPVSRPPSFPQDASGNKSLSCVRMRSCIKKRAEFDKTQIHGPGAWTVTTFQEDGVTPRRSHINACMHLPIHTYKCTHTHVRILVDIHAFRQSILASIQCKCTHACMHACIYAYSGLTYVNTVANRVLTYPIGKFEEPFEGLFAHVCARTHTPLGTPPPSHTHFV